MCCLGGLLHSERLLGLYSRRWSVGWVAYTATGSGGAGWVAYTVGAGGVEWVAILPALEVSDGSDTRWSDYGLPILPALDVSDGLPILPALEVSDG